MRKVIKNINIQQIEETQINTEYITIFCRERAKSARAPQQHVIKMEIDKEDIIKAHDHSSNHYDEIITSEICGCFYCQETYKPSEIIEWIDDGTCAICPKCGIDSVIG